MSRYLKDTLKFSTLFIKEKSMKNNGLVLGVIPDGNRTWAQGAGVELACAYHKGVDTAVELVKAARNEGASRIVFYVLSRENLQRRSPEQVRAILSGVERFLLRMRDHGIAVQCHGDYKRAPEVARLAKLQNGGGTDDMHVDLLLNYSAAWDMETIPVRTISIPPMDVVIRTSGKTRLTGFLPWQSAYSELFFTNTLWPDFTTVEFQGLMGLYRSQKKGPTGA